MPYVDDRIACSMADVDALKHYDQIFDALPKSGFVRVMENLESHGIS